MRYGNCLPFAGGLGSISVYFGVHVAHHFSFLCCAFCFVCLHSVSCVQYCLFLWIVHM